MPYIYRHIRPDKNEVFYIGYGSDKNYKRAHSNRSRTFYWNNVVNKNNGVFEVEIIFEHEDKEFIKEKEVEFISLYGRKDLGQGTLVNLTNGGDGTHGSIQREETIQKRRNNYYEGKTGLRGFKGEENVRSIKVREIKTGKIFSTQTEASKYLGMTQCWFNDKMNCKKGAINDTGFEFVDEWRNKEAKERFDSFARTIRDKVINFETKEILNNVNQLATLLKKDSKLIKGKLTGKYRNNINWMYLSDYEAGFLPTDFYISKEKRTPVINTQTKEIFPAIKTLAKTIGMTESVLAFKIKGKNYNDTPYQLLEDYEKGLSQNWNYTKSRKNQKKLIDTITLEIYDSISIAAQKLGINFNTLANYLNPNCPNPNKTNLIYLSEYQELHPDYVPNFDASLSVPELN